MSVARSQEEVNEIPFSWRGWYADIRDDTVFCCWQDGEESTAPTDGSIIFVVQGTIVERRPDDFDELFIRHLFGWGLDRESFVKMVIRHSHAAVRCKDDKFQTNLDLTGSISGLLANKYLSATQRMPS